MCGLGLGRGILCNFYLEDPIRRTTEEADHPAKTEHPQGCEHSLWPNKLTVLELPASLKNNRTRFTNQIPTKQSTDHSVVIRIDAVVR